MSVNKYHLKNGFYVFTNNNHKFGTDAVCLADFSFPKKHETVVDLGTGCGIIPLLFRASGAENEIKALEISSDAVNLCDMANDLIIPDSQKIDFICGDLKQYKDYFKPASFNLVTMNPPYKSASDGVKSLNYQKQIANHEILCNLDDICKCASVLLNFGGRFCLCNRPQRMKEIFDTCSKYNLEPKRLRFVHQNANSAPSLVLIESKLGSASGITVEPPLFLQNIDGTQTEEMKLIMSKCYDNSEG